MSLPPNQPSNCQDPPPLTKYQKEWASYLSIAANVPNAIFVIAHALAGHRFAMSSRLVVSQAGQIVVFSAILVLAAVDSDDWQQAFLVSNLVVVVLINIFAAVFQVRYPILLALSSHQTPPHPSSQIPSPKKFPSISIFSYKTENVQFLGR